MRSTEHEATALASDRRKEGARRGLLFWLRAARAPFFTGSFAPALVGSATAYHELGGLDWLRAFLVLVGLTAIHAGANLANDYYDHLSGNDEINVSRAAPFTGGSRFIQDGLARPRDLLLASLVCLGVGGIVGLYLTYLAGWPILALGLFGGLTGFAYTAPPLKLGYRGLGEAIVFLNFGLLPVLGAHFVQTGGFGLGPLLAGTVVGLLMANVLWINQFQDADADEAVGKRHWVVRLGRRRAALVHTGLFGTTYTLLALCVWAQLLPAGVLLALLSLPLACWAAVVSLRRYDQLEALRPANVATILTHISSSVLLAAGLVLPSCA
ncbi:MAG: 1,4-dihydroxy-2-naphthoate octaprenyltransferase [Armatimonadetes bacterium]|nr:1,4-dihydroxy-2-naphthoate octaprenyltransferase [Armatimonadota bacterium]